MQKQDPQISADFTDYIKVLPGLAWDSQESQAQSLRALISFSAPKGQ